MKNALPTTAFVVVVTNQFTKISSGLQVDTNYIERLERVTKNQEQFQTLFDTIYEKIVYVCMYVSCICMYAHTGFALNKNKIK